MIEELSKKEFFEMNETEQILYLQTVINRLETGITPDEFTQTALQILHGDITFTIRSLTMKYINNLLLSDPKKFSTQVPSTEILSIIENCSITFENMNVSHINTPSQELKRFLTLYCAIKEEEEVYETLFSSITSFTYMQIQISDVKSLENSIMRLLLAQIRVFSEIVGEEVILLFFGFLVNVLRCMEGLRMEFVEDGLNYGNEGHLRMIKKFKEGKINTLIATCVAEEGLDIGNVDLIISYDCLSSPIRMIQRFGRTGR